MRRAAGLAICAMLIAACASPIARPTPGGQAVERDDFRFVAPTGWEVGRSTELSYGPAQRVIYLANQPLHDDCVVDVIGETCQPPIDDGLRPGGVLVIWTVISCVAQSCDLPAGRLIPIGNRRGVRVAGDQGCETTGFTEGSEFYVTVTPQRVDLLVVCARDPSDTTRSAFLGFLDAIHWRIP